MDKAVNTFEEIKKAGFEVGYISYALLVNGYAKSNYDTKAVEIMKEMEKLGMPIGVEVIDSVVGVLSRKVFLLWFSIIICYLYHLGFY